MCIHITRLGPNLNTALRWDVFNDDLYYNQLSPEELYVVNTKIQPMRDILGHG